MDDLGKSNGSEPGYESHGPVYTRASHEEPVEGQREEAREERRTFETVAGGSISEAVGGVGAAVLAIIGLAGLLPSYMLAVATMAVGVALLSQGSAIAARYSQLVHEAGNGRWATAELGGGVSAEFFGGVTGLVLGILALLRVAPMTLAPVAIIVFGASLLVGSGAVSTVNRVPTPSRHEHFERIAREATRAASGAQMLIGVGAATLGIIALVGISTMTVSLVALLGLGGAILLSGSAVSSRIMGLLYH